MKQTQIRGKNGYAIPLLYELPEQCGGVVVVCHGFGSAKDSHTGLLLARSLPLYGLGVVCFDFPAHGDSPVDGEQLRIANCLDDLAAVEEWAAAEQPQAQLCYFGSSFGAYILALYLALREHRGERAMLRCAAVTMPQLVAQDLATPKYAEQLRRQGYCLFDDYCAPLKLTTGFIADLNSHDVFELCRADMARLLLIQGTADTDVPPQQAQRFAERFGAELVWVEGAGHRFDLPGQSERVAAVAAEFFTRP